MAEILPRVSEDIIRLSCEDRMAWLHLQCPCVSLSPTVVDGPYYNTPYMFKTTAESGVRRGRRSRWFGLPASGHQHLTLVRPRAYHKDQGCRAERTDEDTRGTRTFRLADEEAHGTVSRRRCWSS